MTSLVSDLVINPVLRQARRFSTFAGEIAASANSEASNRPLEARRRSSEDVIGGSEDERPRTAGGENRSRSSSSVVVVPTRATHQSPQRGDVGAEEEGDDDARARPASQSSASHADSHSAQQIMPGQDDWEELGARGSPGDAAALTQAHRRTKSLPEDDGFGELRKRIKEIQARDISTSEKARQMHELLMEGYTRSQMAGRLKPRPTTPTVGAPPTTSGPSQPPAATTTSQGPLDVALKFWHSSVGDPSQERVHIVVSDEDRKPTYAPRQPQSDARESDEQEHGLGRDAAVGRGKASAAAGKAPDRGPGQALQEEEQQDDQQEEQLYLGCEHYRRNVKLQCSTCQRWHTCRLCHDAVEDHVLVRRETRNMLCMLCGLAQRASDTCVGCGQTAANYYCDVCKLWEDDPTKHIYHCNDCGICRKGRGIGKDFFHCKTCNACLSMAMEKSHRCIERLVDCDCPICGDYLFSSTKSVVFMRCGHSIHQTCYDSHRQVSYRCPICAKSLFNMETQFRNLDIAIQNQPMPPEFRDTRAIISCNDCLAKSSVKYHWLGLKCAICNSYNTAEHQILAGPDRGVPNRPSDAGDGEAQGVATAAQLRPQTQALSSAPDSTTGAAAASLPREVILRRRHSSNVSALGSYQPPERLAKSVSPPQMSHASSAADVSDGHEDDSEDVEDDDDEGSDILAFWGRDNEVRSVRSAEDMTLGSGEGRGRDAKDHLDGEEGEEEEGESDGEEDDLDDEDEDDDEDDDDDEEDEIVLVGHR